MEITTESNNSSFFYSTEINCSKGTFVHKEDAVAEEDIQAVLSRFFKSGTYTDVTLQVRWNKRTTSFKAHKTVLSVRSPVFARQLLHKHPFSCLTFVVEGACPRIMEIFLWYLYSDNILAESAEEIVDFAKIAHYYQVRVIKKCQQILSSLVPQKENVCSLLDAATFFKMSSLKRKCIEIIQRCPMSIFTSKGFLNASQDTVSMTLKLSMKTITKNQSMMAVLRWLQHKKGADRSILSDFDLSTLTLDEFLDLMQDYPNFVTTKEAVSIIANKLRPGMISLPSWYDVSLKANATAVPVEVTAALIVENSMRLENSCNTFLHKAFLFGRDGFNYSVTVQLKLNDSRQQRLSLAMLELAFGSDFVPKDLLKVTLFAYWQTFASIKKKEVSISLQATSDNYYVILRDSFDIHRNYPLIFTIHIEVKDLKLWRDDGQLSNNQYRVMQIPENIFYSSQLTGNKKAHVLLTALSDWLAFLELPSGKKSFLFTAFYFKEFPKTE